MSQRHRALRSQSISVSSGVGWNFPLLTLFHQSQYALFLRYTDIKEALRYSLISGIFSFIHVRRIVVSPWWHFRFDEI